MHHGIEEDARLSLLFFATLALSHISRYEHWLKFLCKVLFVSHSGLYGCLFSFTPMDLDSSGLASFALSDTRHLNSDVLFTLNRPQTGLFNQNTSFLMDRMHDTRMAPDTSPMVSVLLIVCALNPFFFQNMLSSPLDLQISRVSEDQLMASGNTVYLQSQLLIECQRRKIDELESQIRMLELDIMMWKTRYTSTQ